MTCNETAESINDSLSKMFYHEEMYPIKIRVSSFPIDKFWLLCFELQNEEKLIL